MENRYLTYLEFMELGGEIPESTFNSKEYQVQKKIDLYTFNRLKKVEDIPYDVKMCIFNLIPIIDDKIDSNIISESIGNYSVQRKSTNEVEKDIKDIIKAHLSGVEINNIPILYPGADEN